MGLQKKASITDHCIPVLSTYFNVERVGGAPIKARWIVNVHQYTECCPFCNNHSYGLLEGVFSTVVQAVLFLSTFCITVHILAMLIFLTPNTFTTRVWWGSGAIVQLTSQVSLSCSSL